jgi:hypothetical protein
MHTEDLLITRARCSRVPPPIVPKSLDAYAAPKAAQEPQLDKPP